jgi:hypothetical protein
MMCRICIGIGEVSKCQSVRGSVRNSSWCVVYVSVLERYVSINRTDWHLLTSPIPIHIRHIMRSYGLNLAQIDTYSPHQYRYIYDTSWGVTDWTSHRLTLTHLTNTDTSWCVVYVSVLERYVSINLCEVQSVPPHDVSYMYRYWWGK